MRTNTMKVAVGQGTIEPAKGTVHPAPRRFTRDHTTWFVDFSTTRGLAVARDGGPPTYVGTQLAEFVSGAGQGTIEPAKGTVHPAPRRGDVVVMEANFEFHDDAEHNRAVRNAVAAGIGLEVLPLRVSGRYKASIDWAYGRDGESKDGRLKDERSERSLHGQRATRRWCRARGIPNWGEDDDFTAVEGIRAAWLDGQTVKRVGLLRPIKDRSLKDTYASKRTNQDVMMDDPVVRSWLALLPPVEELVAMDPEAADALTQGKDYTLQTVIPMVLAALVSPTRAEFDRELGQYAHGYPGLYRSNLTRRTDVLAKRLWKDAGHEDKLQDTKYPGANPEGHLVVKEARRVVRRASRVVYHYVRNGGWAGHPQSRDGHAISRPSTGS